MSYLLRENLELFAGPKGAAIRCAKCGHVFCRAGEDWKKASAVRLLPPTSAGPLMSEASGKYLLQQNSCPSCGVLLDTDLIEETIPAEAEEKALEKPELGPVEANSRTTAILVLDLGARCEDPKLTCHALLPGVAGFLEKARAAMVPIIFSVSASQRGTPMEKVARQLQRREEEPVIYPDGFDKFTGGELQRILAPKGIKTLIITGSATNVAVLYTATAAARIHCYEVIVPVDGVNARTRYAHDYSLYQLSVLPGGVSKRIRFTMLGATRFV
jgi:nicotinamidase-related amidase/phage FluMu protein Com